jgi:hypothetical protein
MQQLIGRVGTLRLSIVGAVTASFLALYAWAATSAHAAASPTTGVDYVADLVTPVKAELTLAIVAGLALLVVLMAVKAGIKLVRGFGR